MENVFVSYNSYHNDKYKPLNTGSMVVKIVLAFVTRATEYLDNVMHTLIGSCAQCHVE